MLKRRNKMTKAKDLLKFAGSCDDLDIEKSQKDWKIMNNQFSDDRPLTEETLKELGFVDRVLKIGEIALVSFRIKSKSLYWWVEISHFDWMEAYPKWKTVGSVRLLIEALKGGFK